MENLKEEINLIILTHNDYDGISAGIIGKVVYPNAKVEFCNYDDINEKVLEYLGKDVIFITDISVNEEVAEKLKKTILNTMIVYYYLTIIKLQNG